MDERVPSPLDNDSGRPGRRRRTISRRVSTAAGIRQLRRSARVRRAVAPETPCVSFTTRRSPSRRNSARCDTWECSTLPVSLLQNEEPAMRRAQRGGACAMSSAGKSKSNSETFMGLLLSGEHIEAARGVAQKSNEDGPPGGGWPALTLARAAACPRGISAPTSDGARSPHRFRPGHRFLPADTTSHSPAPSH